MTQMHALLPSKLRALLNRACLIDILERYLFLIVHDRDAVRLISVEFQRQYERRDHVTLSSSKHHVMSTTLERVLTG